MLGQPRGNAEVNCQSRCDVSVHISLVVSCLNPCCTRRVCAQERKELIAGGFRDKHFVWGSILLASGVGIAIEGCANTFMRTGRLFPGPHLYAGKYQVAGSLCFPS